MKAKKITENRTVNLKIRLTPKEHEQLKENMVKHGYGSLEEGGKSNYIRHCLFKKEFKVRIYDETAERINIAISDFTKYNRRVCSNFNQVSRFIQASDVFGDAQIQLEEGKKLIGKMLNYTTEVYKILAKIEHFYDVKSNPDLSNTEPSEQIMAQWITDAEEEMKSKIFVGNKTLNDEQIKWLGQGHEIIVKDILRNGKRYTVFVRIEDGRIKKNFVLVETSK